MIGTGDSSNNSHSHFGLVHNTGDISNRGDHVQGHSGNLNNVGGDDQDATQSNNNAVDNPSFLSANMFCPDHDHSHSGHLNNDGNHVQSRSGNHNYHGDHVYGHSGYVNRNADVQHDSWWYETADAEALDLSTTVTSVEDLGHDGNAVFSANRSLSWHDGSYSGFNNGSFNGSNNSLGYNQTWFSGLPEILLADPGNLSSMRKSVNVGSMRTVQWTLRHRFI